MVLKKCVKCDIVKELSEFYKDKSSSDGFDNRCRVCENKTRVLFRETLTESTCTKCGLTKPISEFYKGKVTRCSECEKERTRLYRLQHPDKVKENKRKWKDNNPEKVKEGKKKWNGDNPDKVKGYKKVWERNNPEKLRVYKKKNHKLRTQTDPFYRSICNLRKRTAKYLKQLGVKKDSSMFTMVGCTPQEFRAYLEGKFLEGMSWDNYGINGWHVDHIIPISSANTLEEVKKLCHHTNFQPLWAEDNIKKGNKILVEYSPIID